MNNDAGGALLRAFRTVAANAIDLGTVLHGPDTALGVPPARDHGYWGLAAGELDEFTITRLLAEAERELGQRWPQPLASAAARVHRDGNRSDWEAPALARQQRLSRAAVAAAVTLEDRWIDEVADGITLLCEQTSWCWPAHDDVFARRGTVIPDPAEPHLDLGAGEVAGQLAWLDHLLADALDARYPGIRARLRREVVARVLGPFSGRRDWHWLGLDGDVDNWNPWIHGNVLAAALRLADGPDDRLWRAELVWLVIEGLDRYVTALPEDGAIDEGYGYWWNGACRALEALELLRVATGGLLDGATSTPGLTATVAFPHRMQLGGDWYVNFADSQARPPRDQAWHALHRAAKNAGDADALRHAAAHRRADVPVVTESGGLGRLLVGLTDRVWRAAGTEVAPLPRDSWLPSIQVLVARARAGTSAGLTLAAKGGNNGEHHNHNDIGSFIIASDGVPVIIDPGRGTYTAATFGADRYSHWAMRSDWHNVPEIGGIQQASGARRRASDVIATVTEERSALTLELAAAYPGVDIRWRRQVNLERTIASTGEARVVIDDHWSSARPTEAVVRLVLAGDVRVGRGEAHISPREAAHPLRISWPGEVDASLETRTLDDPLLTEVWGTRITRIAFAVGNRTNFRVIAEREMPIKEDDQ